MKKRTLLTIPLLLALFHGCGEEKDVCLGFDPIITNVKPSFASVSGGNEIQVLGVNFCPDLEVKFSNETSESIAPTVTYKTRTEISVITPPSEIGPGPVDVTVTNIDGRSGFLQQGFTYTPSE